MGPVGPVYWILAVQLDRLGVEFDSLLPVVVCDSLVSLVLQGSRLVLGGGHLSDRIKTRELLLPGRREHTTALSPQL